MTAACGAGGQGMGPKIGSSGYLRVEESVVPAFVLFDRPRSARQATASPTPQGGPAEADTACEVGVSGGSNAPEFELLARWEGA